MTETALSADVTLEAIGGPGVVAIVRAPSPDGLIEAFAALALGGVRAVEVTLTTPGALDLIARTARELGDGVSQPVAVGAGTVLTVTEARDAVSAGASFLISPGFDPEVVAEARRLGAVAIPGALTPTEVMAAQRAGADVVKLFPGRVATPSYLADLLGPLPGSRFLPTGGLTVATASEYVAAGAFAVGVGGALLDLAAVRAGGWDRIRESAAEFVAAVATGRAGAAP